MCVNQILTLVLSEAKVAAKSASTTPEAVKIKPAPRDVQKQIALTEVKVARLMELLSDIKAETKLNVERRQARTLEEREVRLQFTDHLRKSLTLTLLFLG